MTFDGLAPHKAYHDQHSNFNVPGYVSSLIHHFYPDSWADHHTSASMQYTLTYQRNF